MALHTIGSVLAIAVVGLICDRANQRERKFIEFLSEEEKNAAILHTRQDVKLVCYLLAVVIIMLGIIADKI